MSSDDHRLLMEALIFFSSSEDSDDTNNEHDISGYKTLVPATRAPRSTNTTMETGGSKRATNNFPGLSPEELSRGAPKRGHAPTTRGNRATPPQAPATKQPLRRKRVKKCTYAARREEVARLRASTFQLEAQLVHLQQRCRTSDLVRQRARYEQELLAQSRAENERLRTLLSTCASRIQQVQANHHGGAYVEHQYVVL